jgi:plasmid stabilization system protein ParE
MAEYTLGEDVYQDMEDIWEYIAQGSPGAARRWTTELLNAFETLGKTPGIGHTREELTSFDVLFFSVGQYTIIYRLVYGHVDIVAVTQGARDIPIFLKRRMASLANS